MLLGGSDCLCRCGEQDICVAVREGAQRGLGAAQVVRYGGGGHMVSRSVQGATHIRRSRRRGQSLDMSNQQLLSSAVPQQQTLAVVCDLTLRTLMNPFSLMRLTIPHVTAHMQTGLD